MRVLLDNCVPRRFGVRLDGHSVVHASRAGLAELSNGDLLRGGEAGGFDVLLTVDRHLGAEQNRGDLPIPVVVMFATRNTEMALLPLLPAVLATLDQRLQRRVYTVGPAKQRGA